MAVARETKIEKFRKLYKQEIESGEWITKDDMTEKGFFPTKYSNGKDIRFIKRVYELEEYREGSRIPKFRIIGLKDKATRGIRQDIRKVIKKERCAVLGTSSNIEVDHKNGRYNDERVNNLETQRLDDFQALSKTVNNIKREICKKCTSTGERFDAKEYGFLVSTLNGERIHNEKPNGCEGCYFYDPLHFKEAHGQLLKDLLEKNIGPFREELFHQMYKEAYVRE